MTASNLDLDDAALAAIDGAPGDAPGREPVPDVFATASLVASAR